MSKEVKCVLWTLVVVGVIWWVWMKKNGMGSSAPAAVANV